MNPPPHVRVLKANLNLSLKWGMGPVAEMVPPSGQKISPPPTLAEWDQGLLARRWPPDVPRGGGISTESPSSSWLSNQLNVPPSETKGEAANWPTVSSSLASPSTSHTGPSCGASCLLSIWHCRCLSLTFQANQFWVGKAERNLLSIYKINRSQCWETSPDGPLSQTVERFLFGVSAYPQNSHTCVQYLC